MVALRALFNLGFRAFFLGAGLFALLTMGLWAAVYHGAWPVPLAHLAGAQWHAHEMLYGYALAVVAGFLLTAVGNWTGLPTVQGARLAAMFAAWALARLAFAMGEPGFVFAALFDLLFWAALVAAVATPIVRVGQWRQAGVLAKLALLGAGNVAFYAGLAGGLDEAVRVSLYGGLYLLVSLILTIGARVLPGFIERGVSPPVRVRDPRWITPVGLSLFVAFFIAELVNRTPTLSAALAGLLCIVNTIRLLAWHTPGIWRKPLLWGLYLAFVAITSGFALFALGALMVIPKTLALHAFAIGGVGLATLSMMARVALGHTGRDIHHPPATVAPALALMVLGALARVALPFVLPQSYALAIGLSQALWCGAFALFLVSYAPILLRPRVDGKPG